MGEEAEGDRPAWGWPELVGVFLLGAVGPALAIDLLTRAGLFAWLYGPGLEGLARSTEAGLAGEVARGRMMLWGVSLALPLQLVAGVALMRACGASWAGMGLTWAGAGRQLLATLPLALVLLPAVWGVHAVALWLSGPAEDHVFTKMARAGLSAGEWGLLVFAACVAAPLWEELFYRGLVQPWAAANRPDAGLLCLGMALAAAVAVRLSAFEKAATFLGRVGAMTPAFCVLALALPFAFLARRPAGGVWAAAVLFAFVHAGVWPTPVPLMALAVGLGWLRARWGTLAGPVALHAAFNAAACVMLASEVGRAR